MLNIEQAIHQAAQHLQANRLAEAESLLRAAIQADPNQPEPFRLMGLVAYLAGQFPQAENLIRQGMARHYQPPAEYWDNLSIALNAQGRSAEAEAAALRALALRPNFFEAETNLSAAQRVQGKLAEAEAAARRAVALRPDQAGGYQQLALALQFQGRLEEVIVTYREVLARNPTQVDAWNNLGHAQETLGRLTEAEGSYGRVLQLQPTFAPSQFNIGNVYKAQGRITDAENAYRRAISLQPTLAQAYNNLGQVLFDRGAFDEAEKAFRQALAVQPNLAEAHNNYGNLHLARGRLQDAEASYFQALKANPNMAQAYSNLCNIYRDLGRLGDGIMAGRKALSIQPNFAEAWNNLGNVLQAQGRLDEARSAFEQALTINSAFTIAHTNLLKCNQHLPGVTLARLAELHTEWDRRHAEPLRVTWRPHTNDRDPDRPIRVGLVSADFGQHPVGFFLVRALENLDRTQCHILCYNCRFERDPWTERIAATASVWRNVQTMRAEDLAELIRSDQVDLLIDLSGHTAGNRLLTFARKPAPVQLSWIGYVGTTGMGAIDYVIADRYHVPEGAEVHYREQVLRLPDGYVCFDPPASAPAVSPLPAQDRGHVTFGSFNNPMKLTEPVIALWSEILRRVPTARLALQFRGYEDAETRQRYLNLFAAEKIDHSRLTLYGWEAHDKLLARYNEIDIALDPFPYSGGLTTCEALWMGVPLITCPGETFAGRHSLSHLSNAGLTETIAADQSDYVARAIAMVADLPRLAEMRAGLRERVARSPLCDGPRFAANWQAALREVWQRWCRS